MESHDYVIVGAGSAGCVLANRLSANPDVSVLLIEAGPDDNDMMVKMPRGVAKLLTPSHPRIKTYKVSKGGNRHPEYWLKGATIGGSSSVNGMVYARGAPMDYDGWAAAGCTGWSWADIGPCFVAMEDHVLGAAEWRGAGGPLKVNVQPAGDPLAEALLDGCAANGAPRVEDMNDLDVVRDGGISYVPGNIHRGRRHSAADAFLRPIQRRKNLTILHDTQVLKICFEGKAATGVEVRHDGVTRMIGIRREVIVSAGAIESPKLLQLSGIGPEELLGGLGIPVIAASPDVGRNMRDHRFVSATYRLKKGGFNAAFRGIGLVRSLIEYFLLRRGPLTYAVHEVVGYIKTRPDLPHADAQVGFGLYSMKPGKNGFIIDAEPGLTIGGYFTRPESQGEVRIKSIDPDVPPHIDANYFTTEPDRESAIAILHWIRRLAAQPALEPFIAKEISPGRKVQTDDEIIDANLKYSAPLFHVSGTCRMGADERAVLDPDLRVRGVDRVRVCDTSIFPTMVSGNTNAPAMAAAMHLANRMGE